MRALFAARLLVSLFAVATLPTTPIVTQRRAESASVDLVEIGVTVVDKKGAPVRDLDKDDFTVKDDGQEVPIVTFSEVAEGQESTVEGRSIAILLDDTGVPPAGTSAIQTIARTLVEFTNRHDHVAVVRLSRNRDEAFGDLLDAEARIREYRAGVQPFIPFATQSTALDRVAGISRDLMVNDSGRKIIVCVGSPGVCNVVEPIKSSPAHLYESWVSAVGAAARANVSVYAIIPGNYRLRGGGLVDVTGGEFFATSYDLAPAIRRILQDASNYYLLGYWPGTDSKPRELHSVDVKVKKSGLKVRVRRQRGN